jgi:hypothetical protein
VEVLCTHVWKWTIRPVETVLRRGGARIKEKNEGGEAKIYCKHFCKCHNVSSVQQKYYN